MDQIEKLLRAGFSSGSFEIDGIKLTIDITPGKDTRRKSLPDDFTIVKTIDLAIDYLNLARQTQGGNIIELGLFQGGSYVLIDKLFKPRRLLGVEIENELPPLEQYISDKSDRLHLLLGTSQDDYGTIQRKLSEIDVDRLDIVFDDASHLLAQTRNSFDNLFPLLKPGGYYYIEDWAWAHQPAAQGENHPWTNQPALTNLLLELVLSVGSRSSIENILITDRSVLIKKATGSRTAKPWCNYRLRNKMIPLI